METLFEELVENHVIYYSIEQLEIDCGALTGKHWQEELVQEALRQLRHEIGVTTGKKTVSAPADVAASATGMTYCASWKTGVCPGTAVSNQWQNWNK